MNIDLFDEIKQFVGFTDEDGRLLGKLLPWLRPALPGLAEAFYGSILQFPEARRVLRDEAQVNRLKETLKTWAIKVCTGPYDNEYLQLRARIGRIHVQIGLPQRYMITGMSVIRGYMSRLIQEKAASQEEERAIQTALERILDCELAIMLHTYHLDIQEKLGRQGRLAALGAVAITVNHELKNPLAVLKTSVDALRRQGEMSELDPERVKRHLDKLDRNLNSMQRNISALLEFARYSEPRLEPNDIHAVIQQALDELSIPSGIKIFKRFAEQLPPIPVDAVQLTRVFVNLTSNACEIMGENGTLTIETAAVPEGVRITFSDTGPGVPLELKEKIFEPLWTGRPGGTGMGLAICRNLVEAHRGRIWVESGGPGARFHVELPAPGGKSLAAERAIL